MSEASIDIKIGVDGKEIKEHYKSIEVSLEMHQQKLNKLNQEYCTLLGKTVMPFLVIEYAQTNLDGVEIFNFKGKDYESSFARANNKLYQFANPKNKDTIKFIKNVEKEFQKLTKLNNNANLKLSMYNPPEQEKSQDELSFFNHMKIKGSLQIDPEFIANMIEIVRRISNQFLNSPIMAFIQLFENLTLKLDLSSVSEFPTEVRESLLKWSDFNEWFNKINLPELSKAKGDIVILITLPKLLSIKIRGQASTIAKFIQRN